MVVGKIGVDNLAGTVINMNAMVVVVNQIGAVRLTSAFGSGIYDADVRRIWFRIKIHGSWFMLSCYLVVGSHVCLMFRVDVVVQSHDCRPRKYINKVLGVTVVASKVLYFALGSFLPAQTRGRINKALYIYTGVILVRSHAVSQKGETQLQL